MSQLDRMSPLDLSGSYGSINQLPSGGLARRHSNRIAKVTSAGSSPRNNLRGSTVARTGPSRRFSTQSDDLASSFYAALQKATTSTMPINTTQCYPPFHASLDRKQTCDIPVTAANNDLNIWGHVTPLDEPQFESIHNVPSLYNYSPPQRPLGYQEPESDWPTYIPMVSSSYSDAGDSPHTNQWRHYNGGLSTDTTAVNSPELFSYQQFPEPKTPPSHPVDAGKVEAGKPDEVLVGVGLYDEPDRDTGSWEAPVVTSHFGMRAFDGPLFGSEYVAGKGLTLEETFSPPPLESEGEQDDD